ncbi:MAG: serine--tRNA ligase, partial [Acidimicrobiales bacterium]
MIDVRLIRAEPGAVAAALSRRGGDFTGDVDEVVGLDAEVRRLASERDGLRARVRALSRVVADARRAGDAERAQQLGNESRALGDEERGLDQRHHQAEEALRDRLLRIPNLPAVDCPDGAGAAGNVVLRAEGRAPADFDDHQKVPHWEIGAGLGILDLERGAKLSGSMFALFRGPGARLLRALVQFSLDRQADAFEEIRPPTLVRTQTMVATGHLPKFADEAY